MRRGFSIAAAMASIGLAGAAHAACMSPAPATADQVRSFMQDPGSVLRANAGAGPALVSGIRNLVVSDPGTLSAVMGLIANATPDQRSRIGTGLGQAASACSREPSTAAAIQQAVIGNNDGAVLAAFQSTSGDVRTTATGGGFGGGGGSLGGGGLTANLGAGGAGGGFSRSDGNSAIGNTPFSYTSSGGFSPLIATRSASSPALLAGTAAVSP